MRLFRGDTGLGRAVVRDTGRYRITTDATTRGTWRLHVRIGATTGNLAGESPLLTVQVR